MDSSELHRKLLYCGYDDVADYLKNSPINRHIYKMLLDLIPIYQITVPVVTLFSEIYYQCVRIQSEGNPTEDISRRYLDEEEIWLGPQSGNTNMLVFCIVWALFMRKKQLLINEECFLKLLTPLIADSEFMKAGQVLVKYMADKDLYTPSKFRYMPCPIDEIPMRIDLDYHTSMTTMEKLRNALSLPVESSDVDFNPWRKVTNNFSMNAIDWYINLYSTREDQLRLLERVKRACTMKEYEKLRDFFELTDKQIRAGRYVINSMGYEHINRDYVQTIKKEDPEVLYSRRAMYEYELNDYKRQIRKLEEEHRSDISRLEAKYQAEIAELRQRLEQQPANEAAVANKREGVDELTLTLAEMAAFIKERFTKSGADEVSSMLYRKAIEHGCTGEATFKVIDSIVTDIIQRDAPHQNFDISAHQVNINSEVENKHAEY